MFYVYILKSLKDGKLYIGFTSNLEKRIAKHNSGASKSTRNRLPLQLIYHEKHDTKREALIRERKIKSYKGGEALKELLS
mgnify:CR=1 FL=1